MKTPATCVAYVPVSDHICRIFTEIMTNILHVHFKMPCSLANKSRPMFTSVMAGI